MRIAEFLQPDSVVADLAVQTKDTVLQELSRYLLRVQPGLKLERVVGALQEREKLGSTGIGEGVAIPHAKLAELPKLCASFGVSRTGIDFQAIDGKPTYLFFLLMAPENSAGIHLKALARISRLFKNPKFRSAILESRTADEIYSLICQEDAKA